MLRSVPRIKGGFAHAWVKGAGGEWKRPSNKEEALEGVAQVWEELLCEPARAWEHALIRKRVDGMGNVRGTFDFQAYAHTTPGSIDREVAAAHLHAACCKWAVAPWTPQSVAAIDAFTLHVDRWVLRRSGASWVAQLRGPCHGPAYCVLAIKGLEPGPLDVEACLAAAHSGSAGIVILCSRVAPDQDLVGPLTLRERKDVVRRMMGSRPGPSGWKLRFLDLFPVWAQEAY